MFGPGQRIVRRSIDLVGGVRAGAELGVLVFADYGSSPAKPPPLVRPFGT